MSDKSEKDSIVTSNFKIGDNQLNGMGINLAEWEKINGLYNMEWDVKNGVACQIQNGIM